MTESKNTKFEKYETVNNKKAKPAIKKTTPAPEPSKSERLDRMEKQLNLIEEGLLVLIHSTQWHNLSITPVGTHNPDKHIEGFLTLQEAVTALANDGVAKIVQ